MVLIYFSGSSPVLFFILFPSYGSLRYVYPDIPGARPAVHVHVWQSLQAIIADYRLLRVERAERGKYF